MMFRRKKTQRSWVWSALVTVVFAGIIGGVLWTVDRYIPPQHVFWKPLDTSRPLGFATKQQLMALNFKPSKTCMTLARDTAGFKTVIADPKRTTSGAGKNTCGWDVAAFELKDGTLIKILDDWDGTRKKRNFLREARSAACDLFRVTLSPDFNAAHADHFHLDMGPSSSCR